MRSIDIKMLQAGQYVDQEFFNSNGELLVSKGVQLTDSHIDIMRRRNIFEVFVKDQVEGSELDEILKTDFSKLEELSFEEPESRVTGRALTILPGLRSIPVGLEGLKKLLLSERALQLDKDLRTHRTSDRPVGSALKTRMQQMSVGARSEAYKENIKLTYDDALLQVKDILNRVADASKVDGKDIRTIIERFMRTFISDRNILLNLTWSKQNTKEHLYHHTLNVSLIAINIAAASGYNEEQVVQIGMGALLHDVGMLLVPKDIRLKQGRLSQEEWFEVQKHPILGLHILERVSRLPEAVQFVAYQIHERENGKGYPKQRTGRFIHSFAKIVQCADVFEAVSSPRTYRGAHAPYIGMELLVKMASQGLISGEIVKSFLYYASLFPVGSVVELSDHRVCKVVAANGSSFTKPVVSVIVDQKGNRLDREDVYQIDLNSEFDIQVIRSLPIDVLKSFGLMSGF